MFNNTIRKIKRNILWLKLIKRKNDVMLYYPDVKAQDKRVNVHIHDVIKTGYDYYDNGSYPYNLGDTLALLIINFLLSKKGIKIDKPISGKKHLFTVGSGGLRSFQDTTQYGGLASCTTA